MIYKQYKLKSRLGYFLIVAFTLFVTIPNSSVSAAVATDFKAGNIMNDSIFFNSSTMNPAQIQAFLNAKLPTCDANGTKMYNSTQTRAQYGASTGNPAPYTCMKDYVQATQSKPAEPGLCSAYTGGTKSSSQIIHDVAQACGVNPQVLLVLLQKEQSLVTDDWPWKIQYRSATGFGCPDTAPCDADYYGFFNQVYHGARIYKKYSRDAAQYNYLAGRNNSILFNPNSSCGSSTLFLDNQTTAGLYNYTPYQPNASALANLYGSGDSCSAYGNRNFWRMFSDWFGSTSGGVSLIKSSSNATIYVLYGGQKQPLASLDALRAWGLGALPVTTMDDASIALFPTRGVLTRVAKNPYNSSLYFMADSGGTYDALPNMITNWGYDPNSASLVGDELIAFTSRLGGLSAFITAPNAGAIYAVDGGTLRPFANPESLQTWAGTSTIRLVSTDMLNSLSAGQGLGTNQAQQVGGGQYVINNGKILPLDADTSVIYPRTNVTSISSGLANVLQSGEPASRFVRGPGGTIYLVDNGRKHGIGSLELLFAYTPNGILSVTHFTENELSQIPDGAAIGTRFAYNISDTSKQYYINNGLHTTSDDFSVPSYGFAISPTGLSLAGQQKGPISCSQGLIQAEGSAGIFILDNGVRRPIGSLGILTSIKNSAGNVCVFKPGDVAAIPVGSPIGAFVSNDGINYLLDQNNVYSVSSQTATTLGLSGFQTVSSTFLTNYENRGNLANSFKAGIYYVLGDRGGYHLTTDAAIAKLWGLSGTLQTPSANVLKFIPSKGDLSQFARSSDPNSETIYLIDNAKFLPIGSLDHLFNAGLSNQVVSSYSPGLIGENLGVEWHGYLARDNGTNTVYVLQGGNKHPVPSKLISNWVGTSTPADPTALSPDFLSLLRTGPSVTKSIETNAPGIFGIDNGKKAGIPNIKTYDADYAPALFVTGRLLNSIPNGPAITSR